MSTTSEQTNNKPLQSNVFKTALLFEGGSMRAAYTCAVAVKLLEEGVYFDHVYGISAGSSNLANYLSRDIDRTRISFTSFIGNPQVGSMKTFLQHKGMLNAHYIYQEAGLPGGDLPFDYDTFQANPAQFTIVAIDRDTGEDLYFTRENVRTLDDLMLCVRASSTLPILMPPPKVQGHYCYDGGFATGGGLPVDKILLDGFERVVIVRTRKRGFRRQPDGDYAKVAFKLHPQMRDHVLGRVTTYNKACDLIDQLEREGAAYVFYPEDLTITGTERDVEVLEQNYASGYAQITREWNDLMRFIRAGEDEA